MAPAVLLVTLLVMGVEEGDRRALLLAGLRTGEVLADEGGDIRFLLAEADAFEELEAENKIFFVLLPVPLGGAGEVGFFLRQVFKMQAFFSALFLQYLQFLQSLAWHPLQSPHLPLLFLSSTGFLAAGWRIS